MNLVAQRLKVPSGLIVGSLSFWICSYAVQTWFVALGPEALDVVHIKRAFLTMLGAGVYFALILKLRETAFAGMPLRLFVLLFATLGTSMVLWMLRIAIDAAYAGDPLDPVADARWVLMWLTVFLMWTAVGTVVWEPTPTRRAYIGAIARKSLARLAPDARDMVRPASVAWCRRRAESFETWAPRLDAALWQESVAFGKALDVDVRHRIALPGFVGGGSATAFLYFLTRRLAPLRVIETGVAAGWSSAAFLSAMQRNGKGSLFSSDLPYLGRPHARNVIGAVVSPELRPRWSLYIDGDRSNLPRILEKAQHFEIAHYDSDKSYDGRDFFCGCFLPNQARNTLWLFDDIEDNMHFRDFVDMNGFSSHVFFYDGKYLGLAATPSLYRSLFGDRMS